MALMAGSRKDACGASIRARRSSKQPFITATAGTTPAGSLFWSMCGDSRAPTMKGHPMIFRRAVVTGLVSCAAHVALPAWAKPKSVLAMIDTDNDGTVDLAEAKKAASALFDRLDPDRDGTLDRRELAGRLTAKELAAADPDRDGTLTKDEYLAVVEQRFNAANADRDGTLDAKELTTKAGQKLMRLLK